METAYQQLYSFVAISRVTGAGATLRELILQSLAVAPHDELSKIELQAQLKKTFALKVQPHEVDASLDALVKEGTLSRKKGGVFSLDPVTAEGVRARVRQAQELESSVRQEWLADTRTRFPSLSPTALWTALQKYLSAAFRRHGIQMKIFLDPKFNPPAEHTKSLTALLIESCGTLFSDDDKPAAVEAISDFLGRAHEHEARERYIEQLADGAANFYAFNAPPETTAVMRQKLDRLYLLLDTNFLFGLLDLHVHPMVEVSRDLIETAQRFKLPLELRYHVATKAELQNAIDRAVKNLRKKAVWPQLASRAARYAKDLSGIERKYHELNAATRGGLTVDSFLARYRNITTLLDAHDVQAIPGNTVETTELATKYAAFLERRGADRTKTTQHHDVTLLATILHRRKDAGEVLDVRSWLLTCDFLLYLFDWEDARANDRMPCTVLPNVLWQALRACFDNDPHFDETFAATFAIPEYRTCGSTATNAAAALLETVATHENLPEEVAARVMANSLLVEHLRSIRDPVKFAEYVEGAIAEGQADLEEDRLLLAQRRDDEEVERQRQREDFVRANAKLDEERTVIAKEREAINTERQTFVSREAELQASVEAATAQQRRAARRARIAGYLSAIFGAAIALVCLDRFARWVEWTWLLEHPNRYGLEALVTMSVFFGLAAAFDATFRRWFGAGATAASLLAALLGLLGGPQRPVRPAPPSKSEPRSLQGGSPLPVTTTAATSVGTDSAPATSSPRAGASIR